VGVGNHPQMIIFIKGKLFIQRESLFISKGFKKMKYIRIFDNLKNRSINNLDLISFPILSPIERFTLGISLSIRGTAPLRGTSHKARDSWVVINFD